MEGAPPFESGVGCSPNPNTLRMPRREYANPPVHEVILDLQFKESLSKGQLDAIGEALSDRFGFPSRFNTFELRAAMATTGAEQFDADSTFAGWVFEEREPRWVLRTLKDRITLNHARSESWPRGQYVGWSRIFDRYQESFEELQQFYDPLDIRRIGLRYQNRIAIPTGSELSDWFTLAVEGPGVLGDLYSFNLQHTWGNLRDRSDLSATINLARIAIGDPDRAEENVGVLLDIDVFNLLVENAPSFSETPAWFQGAHQAENEIFEGCITDKLRATFD